MYDKVNSAAFDSFDPDNFGADVVSDRFDPENAVGNLVGKAASHVKSARPGQKLQLNITLTNSAAVALNMELFNALDSISNRCKAEFVNGNYSYIPQLSIEGIAAGGNNIVGFDKNGVLVIKGNAGDPTATISCNEYPYRGLFESTKSMPFQVNFLRFTSNTDAQIDNTIYHTERSIGGKVDTNQISPRAYFKPNQFQSRTIDILAPFGINAQSGLQILVNAGESVRLAFFISRWTKQGA